MSLDVEPHGDDRGQFFARTLCRDEFAERGLVIEFVQGSVSVNPTAGTLRGMHWQAAPHGEAKLIRCVRGAIWDVIVDLRPGSSSFRRWLGVELTAENQRALYVPEEFAHGFQTLRDDFEVEYLISTPYAPSAARGLRYDDPALSIEWRLPVTRISAADRAWPLLGVRIAPSPARAERRRASMPRPSPSSRRAQRGRTSEDHASASASAGGRGLVALSLLRRRAPRQHDRSRHVAAR